MGGAALTLLLDTHVWLWLAAGDRRLPRPHVRRITDAARTGSLLVSPISAWEVALLERRGRIRLGRSIGLWLDEALAVPGLNVAPLTPRIAVSSCHLPEPFHPDPADRMIVATARDLGCTLVTEDQRIRAYGRAGHVRVLA
jgi:PIN domain nuclease of toxin-antitoxin system